MKISLALLAVLGLIGSASATNLNVSLNLLCTAATPLECNQSLTYPGMGGPTTTHADFSVIASGWTLDLKTTSTPAWCDPTHNPGLCSSEGGFTKFALYPTGTVTMTAPGGLTFSGTLSLSSVGFLANGNGGGIFGFSGFWSNGDKAFGHLVQSVSGPGLPLDNAALLRTNVTPEPTTLVLLVTGIIIAVVSGRRFAIARMPTARRLRRAWQTASKSAVGLHC